MKKILKKKLLLLPLIVFGLNLSIINESKATLDQASQKLLSRSTQNFQNGWNDKYSDINYLSNRNTYSYTMYAYVNTRYKCVADGDNSSSDVDIYVYNDRGKLVSWDESTSSTATVIFDKIFSGNIYVYVKMNNYSGGGYYSLWCGYR